MAERLPVGASRNIKSPPSFTSLGSNPPSSDISIASIERLNGQIAAGPEPDSNSQLLSNGSSTTTISNRSSSGYNRLGGGHSEATTRNGSNKSKEGDSRNDSEWVEQDEPGVYITLTSLPGGVKDLKRVRFRYVLPHPPKYTPYRLFFWIFLSYTLN